MRAGYKRKIFAYINEALMRAAFVHCRFNFPVNCDAGDSRTMHRHYNSCHGFGWKRAWSIRHDTQQTRLVGTWIMDPRDEGPIHSRGKMADAR